MNFSYIANQSKVFLIIKKKKMLSPLDFGCTKTVYHGFSETGFYLKYKSNFLVRKNQILLENT